MIQFVVRLFWAAVLASAVLGQDVFILQPKPNTTVKAGADMVVQLAKTVSLTGSDDVVVVIGVFPCASACTCPNVTEVLGDVLYQGPYAAAYHGDAYYPYQNFTVNVPSWYKGPVQLGVAHLYLLGAGASAVLRFANATLNVTSG